MATAFPRSNHRTPERDSALERIRGHHTFLITGLLCLFAGVFDKLANQVLVTLANDRLPGLAGPLVEAPTGFGPQIASLHLGFQQRARLGAVVHVFEQIGADVVERIQSAQVGAGDRSDQISAAAETVFHHGIDGFRVGDAFVHDVERFAQYGELQAIVRISLTIATSQSLNCSYGHHRPPTSCSLSRESERFIRARLRKGRTSSASHPHPRGVRPV